MYLHPPLANSPFEILSASSSLLMVPPDRLRPVRTLVGFLRRWPFLAPGQIDRVDVANAMCAISHLALIEQRGGLNE